MKKAIIFQQLIQKKKKFIIPLIIFLSLFYFGLPLMIWFFPSMLENAKGLFHVPWWWLYAFLQLLMTWVIGWLYWVKAKRFDAMVEKLEQGNHE